jgi:hypothetical protein
MLVYILIVMALICCRKDTANAMMAIQRTPAPHFFKKRADVLSHDDYPDDKNHELFQLFFNRPTEFTNMKEFVVLTMQLRRRTRFRMEICRLMEPDMLAAMLDAKV